MHALSNGSIVRVPSLLRRAYAHPAAAELAAVGALSLAAVVFGPFILDHPLYATAFAGVVLMVLLVVRAPRLALWAAVAGFVLIEEFELSSTTAYFESGIGKSILALRVFGLSFVDAVTLLLLVPVLIRAWTAWRDTGRMQRSPLDAWFLPLLAVYAFGAAHGLFTYLSFSNWTWESRDILYIAAWYVIATRTLSGRDDVVRTIAVILGTFSVKSLLFAYRVFAGKGLFYGFDFYRPALGSDVPMMAVPMITLIAAAVLLGDSRPWLRRGLLALVMYWSVWFIGSLGRASYFTATIALLLTFHLLRRDVRLRHFLIPVGAAVFGAVVYYTLVLTDTNRELVGQMIGTTFNWVDAIALYEDRSIGQRVLEIINISATLTRSGAWLWGLGWGAPWAEIAVLHPIDVASFELMEAVRGVHTSAHIDAVYFLLKVGILGTIAIYAAYARFVLRAMRQFQRERDLIGRLAVIALLVMLVIFLPNYVYFIKLHILIGICIACLSILIADDAGTRAGAA